MDGMGKEVKPRMKKGFWKPEEDSILKKYIETHGEGNWTVVSNKSGLMRGAKSCRLRWKNYLRPNIKHGMMSEDEKDLIIRLHKLLGNRWSLIAGRLPGRTDNEVKNYWNTHLNKTKSAATTTTTTHHRRSKKRDLSASMMSHQQEVEMEKITDSSSTVVGHHSWVDRNDDHDDQNLTKTIEDQDLDYVNNYGLINNMQYLPLFDHFNYEEEAFMMMSLLETGNNFVMPTFGIGSCTTKDHEMLMSDQTPFFF